MVWICPECRSTYTEHVALCERDGAEVAEVLAHQTKSRYPLLGEIVGDRYHLIGGLGQGGLGTVYLARHLHLDQLFAVKFLDLSTLGPEISDNQRSDYHKDFLKEARVASLIRHDAVVRVNDFGVFNDLPFLVMEYVPGPSLLQVLANQGRFPIEEALNVVRRIAEALDAFHERRLVHRDLKPANVILDPRGGGRLTLVDLGLVKDISGPGGRASTHPMALRGTPGYLAPEQVPAWVLSSAGIDGGEKQPVTARVDIYALGVIFYELVAGISPYPDGSNTRIIIHACTQDPLPLSDIRDLSVPPAIETLIYQTMARDPDHRPQSAAAFLARLDEITQPRQASAPNLAPPSFSSPSHSAPNLAPPNLSSPSRSAPNLSPPNLMEAETFESDEIFDDDPTALGAPLAPEEIEEAIAGRKPKPSPLVGGPQVAQRLQGQQPLPPQAPLPGRPVSTPVGAQARGSSPWPWILLLVVFFLSGGVFYVLKSQSRSKTSDPVIIKAEPPIRETQDASIAKVKAVNLGAPDALEEPPPPPDPSAHKAPPARKTTPKRRVKRRRPKRRVAPKPVVDAGPPPTPPEELKIRELIARAKSHWRRDQPAEALRLFQEAQGLMQPSHSEWNSTRDRIRMLKEELRD